MVEKSTIGLLIAAFIGIVFATALLPTIADQTGVMTTKSNVGNESVDISAAWDPDGLGYNNSVAFTVSEFPEGWKINSCPISSFVLKNDSVTFTVTTDYVVTASAGTFTLVPTAAVNGSGNDTLIDYVHCRDGYVTDSATKSIVALIVLFAGLAMLIFVVVRVMVSLKD